MSAVASMKLPAEYTWNSRSVRPAICPPSMIDASNATPCCFIASPWVRYTWRTASPTSPAARNIVGTLKMVSTLPVSGSGRPSWTRFSTAWVIARLPAVRVASRRSPGTWNFWSLEKQEMLSNPALVRVSPSITRPSSSSMPTQ